MEWNNKDEQHRERNKVIIQKMIELSDDYCYIQSHVTDSV
jgi:hypothetical protein